uniref:Uncharacterized protein n=1 Tax=Klebsiella pneumoniae TaxID=573 RepID=A0A8B0ST26_KLEPN|nr:hypothetical protein [Klebsiella pneumoniae]
MTLWKNSPLIEKVTFIAVAALFNYTSIVASLHEKHSNYLILQQINFIQDKFNQKH